MTDSPIKAVIFDVANVIVDWDPRLPLDGHVSEDKIDEFLKHDGFWALNAEADAGVTIAQMLPRIDADMPELSETFRTYVERFDRSVPGALSGTSEIIDELLATGLDVYGLSNWWPENFTVPRAAAPVIDRLADVIVSGHVGLAKPDPAIFELATQRFGVEPATTLFVDDSLPNIEAADALGFATHHFTDAERLRRDLVERGLL